MGRTLIWVSFACVASLLSSAGFADDGSNPRANNERAVTTQPLFDPAATNQPRTRSNTRNPEPALPRVTRSAAPRPQLPAARTANASRTPVELVAQAGASPSPSAAPQQAPVPPPPRFDISRFDVQGNTLLSEADLTEAVGPYTGKNKDFADVQRALESLQIRYQERGYGTVQVMLPEQELERGVIVLRVIEPKLGKVAIDGNKFFDEANIRRSIPSLKEGTVPNSNSIGVDTRLANENPAKRTTVLLRAGENEGEVNATIRVQDDKPWRAVVSFDNTGTPTSGEYRLGLAYQHANLFNLDHTLTIQYLADPEPLRDIDQLKILGLGYRIPLYGLGATLDLLAGYSSLGSASTQVIQSQSFNQSGSGTFFGVRYHHHLPRWTALENYDHRLSFGLDYKAFSNQVTRDTQGFGFNETPDVTVYPASIGYSGTKRWESGEFGVFGSVAQNVYPHGSDAYRSKFTDPVPSPLNPNAEGAARGVGDPRYTIWRYGFNFLHGFANDVQVRLNASGQWTRDALVQGEQFGIGGWDSLRGMVEREAANDRGWRGSVEVYSPNVASKFGLEGARLRFLGFVDTGSLRQNHQQPPCIDTVCGLHATSFGVGVRLSMRNGVSFRLDYGQMLDAGAEGDRGDDRWHFGLAVSF